MFRPVFTVCSCLTLGFSFLLTLLAFCSSCYVVLMLTLRWIFHEAILVGGANLSLTTGESVPLVTSQSLKLFLPTLYKKKY